METKEIQQQLDERKDDLLRLVSAALRVAGLPHIEVRGIRFDLAARLPQCPDGTSPVWEPRTLSDGSVIYELVCK
jgi:hypothetical protein